MGVQRSDRYGQDMGYLACYLNRDKFIAQAQSLGLVLMRGFIIGYQPSIHFAPEQCEHWRSLFRPIQAGTEAVV